MTPTVFLQCVYKCAYIIYMYIYYIYVLCVYIIYICVYICIYLYIDTHLNIYVYMCIHVCIYMCVHVYIHSYINKYFSGPVMQLGTYSLKRSPITWLICFKTNEKDLLNHTQIFSFRHGMLLCYVNLLSISVKDFVKIYHLSLSTLWDKETALIIMAWLCFRLSFFWGTSKILHKSCNTFKTILRLKISYWLTEGIGNVLLFAVDWIRRLQWCLPLAGLGNSDFISQTVTKQLNHGWGFH